MIIVSTNLVVFTKGLNEGTYADMIELATATWTGHIQVQAEGYNDNPSLFKNVEHGDTIRDLIASRGDVASVTTRVDSAGLLAAEARPL